MGFGAKPQPTKQATTKQTPCAVRDDHANIGLDLISLNKYVVTLIKAQAKSCLTYNSFFVAATPLPFIEKILLLLRPNKSDNCRYNWSLHSIRELFFQKFVLSSIIRCLKI